MIQMKTYFSNCRFVASPANSSRCQGRVSLLSCRTHSGCHQPRLPSTQPSFELSDTSLRFVFAAAHSNLLSQPCNHSPPVLHPCHLTVLSNSAQPFTEDCIQRPPGRLSCRHKRMRQTGTLALPSTYLSHSRYQPMGVTRHPTALLHPPPRMTGL
jgi:hypothetical protein